MNMTAYGEWLKQKRGARKRPGFISQQALADAVGVHRTHINKIERGVIGTPEPLLRDQIHEVLGTSEDELIELGIVRVGIFQAGTARATAQAGDITLRAAERVRPYDDPLVQEIAQLLPHQRAAVLGFLAALRAERSDVASPPRIGPLPVTLEPDS